MKRFKLRPEATVECLTKAMSNKLSEVRQPAIRLQPAHNEHGARMFATLIQALRNIERSLAIARLSHNITCTTSMLEWCQMTFSHNTTQHNTHIIHSQIMELVDVCQPLPLKCCVLCNSLWITLTHFDLFLVVRHFTTWNIHSFRLIYVAHLLNGTQPQLHLVKLIAPEPSVSRFG